MHTTETFLSDVLPGLLAGKNELNVLLVSYHRVDEVVEVKDGLRIKVLSGNLRYSDELMSGFLLLGPHPANTAQMKKEGRAAFERTVSGLQMENKGPVLAIVYVGVSAFDESLDLALKIARNPNTDVVVVTCDCNFGQRVQKLDTHVEMGNLKAAVEARYCGGTEAMNDIAREINQIW